MTEHERALAKELLTEKVSCNHRLLLLDLIDQNKKAHGLSDDDLDLLHNIARETRRPPNFSRAALLAKATP